MYNLFCMYHVCMYVCMYVSCTFNKNKFYFSNGLLILRRRCEDEGERADVGVFRKDDRPSIRRGGAFQTSKMHIIGKINNAFIIIGCVGSCCSCGGSCNSAVSVNASVSASVSGRNYLL